ncbi:MAG: RluA family pseudouridine synthase [Prevotella sp.]|nr:RluA family pseudouridine synthase [Alistipes senegalensis]MCM1357526.1 RluA family pseudouridine synthase [Prevotella sp.]MCM1472461.1 RluA family pseudouridine synthase [Muribaculaceae bacterium]
MVTFTVNDNDSGQRVDKFVTKALPDLPKSMMYRLFRKKDIKINGKRCDISAVLTAGDVITVYVRQELSGEKKHDMTFLNSPSDLNIIYEDENILITFKPVGLDPHSNSTSTSDTLINRIKHYLYNKKEYLPENENSFSPALCNRLDRNTSGLIISAKNALALREINEAVRSGNVHKIYRCVTVSAPPESEDIISAYHKKDDTRNIVRISDKKADGYKEIKTGYKVFDHKNGLFLIEVTLFTGRTHQIRAHLAHIGAYILGDGKYGNTALNKRYGVFRQALCAYALKFELPKNSPLAYLNKSDITAPEPFGEYFD